MAKLSERQALADNIRNMRESKGFSQEEVAQAAGVTRNAIDQYEEGNYIPNVISAVAMAKMFGTTCEKLIQANGDKEENATNE